MTRETTFSEAPASSATEIIPPKWRSSTLSEIIKPSVGDSDDDLEVAEILQNEIKRQEKENELLADLKNAKIGCENSFEAKNVMIETTTPTAKESTPIIVRMRPKTQTRVIRKPKLNQF
uniref:Uncharacterized protein n=1 Tax=Panagrolaimus davidi TaxID=227884 RepID=A0A914NXH1_9BILA